MTPPESDVALLPCPFCETVMRWSDATDGWVHPSADCFLTFVSVKRHQVAAWNRRAAIEADPGRKALIEALEKIASFDDALACARLEASGTYANFDEPGSVQIARAALARARGEKP